MNIHVERLTLGLGLILIFVLIVVVFLLMSIGLAYLWENRPLLILLSIVLIMAYLAGSAAMAIEKEEGDMQHEES